MTNFGLWTPFIDERGVQSWYGGFPPALDSLLRSYAASPTDFAPLSSSRFSSVLRAAVGMTDRSVGGMRLKDHNPVHFREARDAAMAAFDKHFGSRARGELLAVRQAYEIAMYCHDCYHCGSTLRADAPGRLHRSELGTNVSLEWVSSLEMIDFGIKHELPVPMIAFIVGVILATTYAGKIARGRGISNIPDVVPSHLISCMTRAADSNPRSDFIGAMRKGMQVNLGEVPATSPPTSYIELVESQVIYLEYLAGCHQRLDAASPGLTRKLGWERTRTAHLAQAKRLLQGQDDHITQQLKTILRKEYSLDW